MSEQKKFRRFTGKKPVIFNMKNINKFSNKKKLPANSQALNDIKIYR